ITGRIYSPLPFVAYMAGAAVAVAGSFFIMAASDPGPPRTPAPGRESGGGLFGGLLGGGS
ncbi:MAG: hypothetical protein L0I76_29700, partial [Pseudonocardia sp.]|nr:hypothetical protein [Pseudonocardia sp.]